MVLNNFFILNRLLQNKGSVYYYDVIQKIFSKTQLIKFRKEKYRNISDILNKNIYAYTNVLEEFVEIGGNINNLWHFVNLVFENLPI